MSLHRELRKLCEQNKDGSYSTQAARQDILKQTASQLYDLGFKGLTAHGLKPKHIDALLKSWRDQQLSTATIKNRMAHLRWWAEKVNRQSVIASNDKLGIGRRKYVTPESKAKTLGSDKLSKITDERIRCSLELQAAFGLRRAESLKFMPKWADLGDKIRLKDTWCKGGRPRTIPITKPEQQAVLEKAKLLAGNGSMIPPDKTYVQWLNRFTGLCQRAGICNVHGLRHNYAQNLYRELTGWKCPKRGGPKATEMTLEQRQIDHDARLQISAVLGHNRLEITYQYC